MPEFDPKRLRELRERVHRMAEFTDDEIDSIAAVITESRRAQVRGGAA